LLLDIPVVLNGVAVDILAWLDTDTGDYYIEGAWPGYDGGMAARQMLPIGDEDQITPYFSTFNATTGNWEYTLGSTFTVSGTPALGIEDLPVGTYNVAFYAEDYAGNGALSDIVAGEYSLARMVPGAASKPNMQVAKDKALQLITNLRGAKIQ
jgi:hypothetical protein